jgi:hypothetical protein
MCNDARAFGIEVCDKFISSSGASDSQVYRVEKRRKTPGRVYRLLQRLERIESSLNDISPNVLRAELHEARQELVRILRELPAEDSKELVELINN